MAKKESEVKRTRRGDKLEVEVIPRIEDTSGLSQDLKTCIESTNIVFNNWHNTVDRDVRTGNYLTCLKNIDEIKSFKEFFIFFLFYALYNYKFKYYMLAINKKYDYDCIFFVIAKCYIIR